MSGGQQRDPVEEGATGFRCGHCGEVITVTVVGGREEITELEVFLDRHRQCLAKTTPESA